MLHSSILAVFWGPSPTLPDKCGKYHETMKYPGKMNLMIPQLNQIGREMRVENMLRKQIP
jgi:hypothetical protein